MSGTSDGVICRNGETYAPASELLCVPCLMLSLPRTPPGNSRWFTLIADLPTSG